MPYSFTIQNNQVNWNYEHSSAHYYTSIRTNDEGERFPTVYVENWDEKTKQYIIDAHPLPPKTRKVTASWGDNGKIVIEPVEIPDDGERPLAYIAVLYGFDEKQQVATEEDVIASKRDKDIVVSGKGFACLYRQDTYATIWRPALWWVDEDPNKSWSNMKDQLQKFTGREIQTSL